MEGIATRGTTQHTEDRQTHKDKERKKTADKVSHRNIRQSHVNRCALCVSYAMYFEQALRSREAHQKDDV